MWAIIEFVVYIPIDEARINCWTIVGPPLFPQFQFGYLVDGFLFI
jgi:hypothetical protein